MANGLQEISTGLYQTSVPGIGVSVSIMGRAVPSTGDLIRNGVWYSAFGDPRSLNVTYTLVKTGPIGAGVVYGSELPSVVYRFGDLKLVTGSAVGQVKVLPLTCQVPTQVSVDLGQHAVADFAGAGRPQSAPAKAFDLTIAHCPPGMQAVQVSLAPLTEHLGSGVVALDGTSSAVGVGIQLLDDSGAPVDFQRRHDTGYQGAVGGTVTQRFRARLFQTADRIQPGSANSVLAYTVHYL